MFMAPSLKKRSGIMALLSSEWVDISRKSRSQPQVFYSVLGTAKQVSPPTDAFSNCSGPCRALDGTDASLSRISADLGTMARGMRQDCQLVPLPRRQS